MGVAWGGQQNRRQDARPVSQPSELLWQQRSELPGDPLCLIDNIDCRMFETLSDAAPDWQALGKSSAHSPFQQYFWADAIAEAIRERGHTKPIVVIGYRDGEPCIALPLAIVRDWSGSRLTWLGSESNDYNAPVAAPTVSSEDLAAAIDGIITALQSRYRPLDALFLTRHPDLPELPAFASHKSGPLGINWPGTGTVEAEYRSHLRDLLGDWQETYRQMRSAKSRRRLRSKNNNLRQNGRVIFRKVREPGERRRVAHAVLDLKGRQLEKMGNNNPFTTGPDGGILRDVIVSALDAPESNLGVYALFLEDELLAGMIAFADNDVFSLFVTAYEPDKHANCSPGALLLVKSMELATRAGYKTFDFLIGDEPYKFEWTNRQIAISHHLQALTLRGLIFCTLQSRRLWIKKWLLARPKAKAFVLRLNKSRRKQQPIAEKSGEPVASP